jgi:predicted nucleic acid-binding protein
VKFWDSSALVSLVVKEDRSEEMRLLLTGDPNLVVSFLTLIEVRAAAARRLIRSSSSTRRDPEAFVTFLESAWTVVDDYSLIMAEARRVVRDQRLRAADAIQLASVFILCRDRPKLPFVTLDEELAAAARLEGFPVLP